MKNNNQILKDIEDYEIHIDDVPKEFWSNEEYIYKLLDVNEEVFKFFSDEKKYSKEFVINLITKYNCHKVYEFLPDQLKDDKDVLDICIEYNLDKVSDKYKLDDNLIRRCISKDPISICYFPDSVKDNIEYVTLAIKKEGRCLIHGSERLRSNIDLVFESTYLSEDPDTIVFEELGESLKNNFTELKKLIDRYLEDYKKTEYIINTLVKEINEDLKKPITDYIDSKNLYIDKIWDTKKIRWDDDFSYDNEENNVENDLNTYTVKFILESFYEDEKENRKVVTEKQYKSLNIETLFDLIDEEISNDIIDDSICINLDSISELINTNIEYVEIKDKNNNIVYQQNN